MPLSCEQQATILNLSRAFVREALLARAPQCPPDCEPWLRDPTGCFVSLHALDGRRLRGCVGRIDASQPLIEALCSASVHVLRDPRFTRDPVRLEELPLLEIEVSVVSAPTLAAGPLAFDLLNDGIYLSFGTRTGCFLPQVARETGWSREQLLERLCVEKLGFPQQTWRHPDARLHTFSVVVIGPERFEPGMPPRDGREVRQSSLRSHPHPGE
jgi:AmmeMemoRadiSam system protein A